MNRRFLPALAERKTHESITRYLLCLLSSELRFAEAPPFREVRKRWPTSRRRNPTETPRSADCLLVLTGPYYPNWSVGPPAVRPLMKLELRVKYERIAFNKRKPMIPNFKVSGQPITPEVRSIKHQLGQPLAAGRLP